MLNKLAGPEHRLIIIGRDDKLVEITHESLIHRWTTIQDWLEKDNCREFLIWQEDLQVRCEDWQNNKKQIFLLQGDGLDQALKWQSDYKEYLLDHELEFIHASERAKKKTRIKKQAVIITPCVVSLVIWGLLQDSPQHDIWGFKDDSQPRNRIETFSEEHAVNKALFISPSMGQNIESFKDPLQLGSIKIFLDTGVFQEKPDESASVSYHKSVHNIMHNSMLHGQERELSILFLQDCRATPLYRTFMEGIKFFQQVEENGRESVYTENTPADLKNTAPCSHPRHPAKANSTRCWNGPRSSRGSESRLCRPSLRDTKKRGKQLDVHSKWA